MYNWKGLPPCVYSRELAFQIGEQFDALGAGIGVKCGVVVGGVDMVTQALVLAKKPHVVIGEPRTHTTRMHAPTHPHRTHTAHTHIHSSSHPRSAGGPSGEHKRIQPSFFEIPCDGRG